MRATMAEWPAVVTAFLRSGSRPRLVCTTFSRPRLVEHCAACYLAPSPPRSPQSNGRTSLRKPSAPSVLSSSRRCSSIDGPSGVSQPGRHIHTDRNRSAHLNVPVAALLCGRRRGGRRKRHSLAMRSPTETMASASGTTTVPSARPSRFFAVAVHDPLMEPVSCAPTTKGTPSSS